MHVLATLFRSRLCFPIERRRSNSRERTATVTEIHWNVIIDIVLSFFNSFEADGHSSRSFMPIHCHKHLRTTVFRKQVSNELKDN